MGRTKANFSVKIFGERQQKGNMLHVELVWATFNVATSSGNFGPYYAAINLLSAKTMTSHSELPDTDKIIAILPIGCVATKSSGEIGLMTPRAWASTHLVNYEWAITTPTNEEYGAAFAFLVSS